ncbi:MAG: ABC transporter permease [Bacillota bacterium]|nr:MAG: ABC transporter permease [Bacillota bacterium]
MNKGMGYIGRRILLILPTVLGAFTLVFFIVHLAPGDPIDVLLMDVESGTAEQIKQELREQFGLDKPIHEQYFIFLKNTITGDLGTSIIRRQPVSKVLAPTIKPTIMLAVSAVALSVIIGVPAGVASALRRNRPTDYIIMTVAVIWLSVPGFWLGILLIYYLGFKVAIFPMFGGGAGGGFTSELYHLVLPAFAVGARSAALVARMARSSILEVLNQDYIRTARSKGLRERVVVYKHALRNAVIPVITVVGMDLAYLLGGTVIVETVFGRVGLGKTMIDAITQRDYPVVQGAILLFAVGIVLVNFLTDLAYAIANPRIRLGK